MKYGRSTYRYAVIAFHLFASSNYWSNVKEMYIVNVKMVFNYTQFGMSNNFLHNQSELDTLSLGEREFSAASIQAELLSKQPDYFDMSVTRRQLW